MYRHNAAKFSQLLELFRSRINTYGCAPEKFKFEFIILCKRRHLMPRFSWRPCFSLQGNSRWTFLSLIMLLHATVVWIIFHKRYLTYFKVLWYHMCCTHLTDGYWYLCSSASTLAEAYAKLLMILKLCQLTSYWSFWWNVIAYFTRSTSEFFSLIFI